MTRPLGKSEEERTAAVEAYKAGGTLVSVAKQFGVYKTTIRHWLAIAGVELHPPRRISYRTRVDAIAAMKAGETIPDCADRLGLKYETVRSWARVEKIAYRRAPNRKTHDPALVKRAQEMRAAGALIRTISGELGLSLSQVKRLTCPEGLNAKASGRRLELPPDLSRLLNAAARKRGMPPKQLGVRLVEAALLPDNNGGNLVAALLDR